MVAQACKAFARLAAALLLAVATFPAVSHQPESAQPATISSASVIATGTVVALTVTNQVTGATLRYFGLTVDQGGTYALNGPGLGALVDGVRIDATGTVTGNVFNVQRFSATAQANPTPRALVRKSIAGKLAIAHADYFAEGRGTYTMVVLSADGHSTSLKLPVEPETIQVGMSVVVDGTLDTDGSTLNVSNITIVAMPEASANAVSAAPITNNVLVMVVKFTDSPASDVFTPATVNTEFQTQVAKLYQEQSFGQQLLNITIACYTTPAPAGCATGTAPGGWLKGLDPTTHLPIATPASCDYTSVGAAADQAAKSAGYTLGNYQNRYYIMPYNSACGGWAGLAYIGYPYQSWGNGYYQLWVSGHELGHNFTLWHAGNLTCPGQSIGPGCVNTNGEYGDPFDVMGNIYPGHFNAAQKAELSWLPAGSVKVHTAGTATYTLSPIESPGQPTYAIKIPAASNRTYWIEYRQPIGFDSANTASFNGAQIRVGTPLQFPYSCPPYSCGDDTQILDMSPNTPGNFSDAALLPGQTYTDSDYNVHISVASATPSALTLTVSMPGASPAPTAAGAVSRKTHGAAGVFDLPLSMVATNPTTEPRQGPAQTIAFDFGKPITSATATVTEGIATASAPTFSGNSVIVNLSGVANQQYVTVALSNVVSADGGTGGTGSVRVGFLVGDVSQNRVVTVSDVVLMNAVIAHAVTASNYLKDVNANGALTVADKVIVNANVAKALPAP